MNDEEGFRRLQAEMERRAHPPSEHADDIDKARQFTAELSITLAGESFKVKPTGGLIALFTYVSTGSVQWETEEERNQAGLAAMHKLLQESMTPAEFGRFEHHAMASKAGHEDIEPCVRQLIEAYTARPYWPALRLLASAAAHMAELDGWVLMGTGRSLSTFNAREVCNLQLTRLLSAQQDEDAREVFLEDLYLDWDPASTAEGLALQMIASKKRQGEPASEQPAGPDTGDAEAEDAGDHGDRAVDDSPW